MPQNTPRKVAVSPARAGHPSEAARAFDAIAPELDRVAPDELLPINVDIPRVVSTVLGAEPILLSYAAEIKAQLPKHPQADLTKLRTYGLAALHAHLRAQPAPKSTDLTELLAEATRLKQTLLVAAEALAFAELLDGERLAEIRAGAGHLDLASDLVALGALFDASWSQLAGKTVVTEVQVERASALGTQLLVALGEREHARTRATPEASDQRRRAFTLLARAYDSARRALTYLRWEEDDVDLIAPSLYARSRRGAATAQAVTPADAQPAAPAPVAEA